MEKFIFQFNHLFINIIIDKTLRHQIIQQALNHRGIHFRVDAFGDIIGRDNPFFNFVGV